MPANFVWDEDPEAINDALERFAKRVKPDRKLACRWHLLEPVRRVPKPTADSKSMTCEEFAFRPVLFRYGTAARIALAGKNLAPPVCREPESNGTLSELNHSTPRQ